MLSSSNQPSWHCGCIGLQRLESQFFWMDTKLSQFGFVNSYCIILCFGSVCQTLFEIFKQLILSLQRFFDAFGQISHKFGFQIRSVEHFIEGALLLFEVLLQVVQFFVEEVIPLRRHVLHCVECLVEILLQLFFLFLNFVEFILTCFLGRLPCLRFLDQILQPSLGVLQRHLQHGVIFDLIAQTFFPCKDVAALLLQIDLVNPVLVFQLCL